MLKNDSKSQCVLAVSFLPPVRNNIFYEIETLGLGPPIAPSFKKVWNRPRSTLKKKLEVHISELLFFF